MKTVKEFIDSLNKFDPNTQIVIADGDCAADPFPCHFQLVKGKYLNKDSGKDVVLIDYFRKFLK